MTDLPVARQVLPPGSDPAPAGTVRLDYEGRLIRRRRLETEGGLAFLVDLPEATDLPSGALLRLDDGRSVAVAAGEERLLEVRGNLPLLAWHIGNRHTPCEIAADRLVIRDDPVLAEMLRGLGADLRPVTAAFAPGGGAYGVGRTFGHDHGHHGHHDHGPDHDHDHHHHAHRAAHDRR